MKTISAVFATSQQVERLQLAFDPLTGLIEAFGHLGVPTHRLDWFFNDECLAFAGLGDIHIHAREDASQQQVYKEDFQTAAQAALNGGVTHVADMPNNPIPPIDDHSYQQKLQLSQRADIPYLLYAGIGPQTKPLSVRVPYKAYMGPSIGELYFKNTEELQLAISRYQEQWVSFHCEDPVEMERFKHASAHHLRRPASCEVLATQTALDLIERYQLHGKLCHYSASEGLALVRKARTRGVNVALEVTPQHLYFSQEVLQEKERNYFQMNPPIRTEADREAMLAAAREGEVDFLATDHAPHTEEEKIKGTSGLTGLDSYGGFITWLLREQKFSPQRIATMCAENPGRFANTFLPTLKAWSPRHRQLGLGVGQLAQGYVANFTILNLYHPTRLTAAMLRTKVRHNPFVGVTFPGCVEQVFLQGRPQR